MRICMPHWTVMRGAVDRFGMSALVAKDGKTAVDSAIADLQGEPDPKNERFDPLMSMHWHWTNNALRLGGLYLMTLKPDGSEYCPVCEFEKHAPGFEALPEIDKVAEQMAAHCRETGLIAGVQ